MVGRLCNKLISIFRKCIKQNKGRVQHGLGGERRCCNISSFWASVNCFLRPRRLAPARTPSEWSQKLN